VKIYIDSDVFVSFIEKNETTHPYSKKFFERIFKLNGKYEAKKKAKGEKLRAR